VRGAASLPAGPVAFDAIEAGEDALHRHGAVLRSTCWWRARRV
jgi:hypothetical protein